MNVPRKLPGNLETNRLLERWLRINADGTVTVYTGKVEIGQGILTAITQVVADELDVSPQRVRLQTAGTVEGPDEGITSGSRSIEESAVALRYACAEVRELLLQRAATRLGVSLEKVTVADGLVNGFEQVGESETGAGADGDGIGVKGSPFGEGLFAFFGVDFVEQKDLGFSFDADLAEDLVDGCELLLGVGMADIEHM